MATLTGKEIAKQVKLGKITIEPFDETQVNPNSYDLKLGPRLLAYDMRKIGYLDVRQDNPIQEVWNFDTRGESFLLEPNRLYLGATTECLGSDHFVSFVEGKSSLGRLGIVAHVCAGWIDCGFCGNITLEITAIHPVRIYRDMRIGQICFAEVVGEIELYRGKYINPTGVEGSKSWKEFADAPAQSKTT